MAIMHRITYRDTFSRWDEALPLGNGHFGMMGYCDENDGLTFVINHYDVYYRKFWQYARRHRVAGILGSAWWEAPARDVVRERALAAHADPADPGHNNYLAVMDPTVAAQYGVSRPGVAQVIAGSLRFLPHPAFNDPHGLLTELRIEDAVFINAQQTKVAGEHHGYHLRAIVAQDTDVCIFTLAQQQPGDIGSLILGVPQSRQLDISTTIGQVGESVFYHEGSFYSDGEDRTRTTPFRYLMLLKLIGARGKRMAGLREHEQQIALEATGGEITVLVTVVTEEDSPDLLACALAKVEGVAGNRQQTMDTHQRYWQSFWSRSSVTLPDHLLETLWYLHLYSLACCSGAGARLFEQACGLNGLWDIKTPTQWGSMWYWDVNIEQAFWPIYTANHPELGHPFYRALLANLPQARTYAQTAYGYDDCLAPDYPFPYYHCVWPWCAQYFIWHVRYTNDITFLREQAYPLYRAILRFFERYLTVDPATGAAVLFPTVSPEQGPMTRNSTITLSCVRYLLQAALEANDMLGEDTAEYARWTALLATLPDYPTGQSHDFGLALKDSEWAPADMYLAHSSLLMPIYPTSEFGKHSDPAAKMLALNTLRYACERQNLGTHNFGWLACAAARLGLGNEALAYLYDLGIAFLMRANGLFGEETERWMQNCLVASAPVYNPSLMESGSAVVAAINEMLLQSKGGVIEVFPAIPDGTAVASRDEERFGKHGITSGGHLVQWKDCTFQRLLAEGAFEVSACLLGGAVTEVTVTSLAGNTLRLVNPFPEGEAVQVHLTDELVAYQHEVDLLTLPTTAGASYRFSTVTAAPAVPLSPKAVTSHCWTSPQRRRIFLGKNRETDYLRALDGMTCDFYAGDQCVSPITRY